MSERRPSGVRTLSIFVWTPSAWWPSSLGEKRITASLLQPSGCRERPRPPVPGKTASPVPGASARAHSLNFLSAVKVAR